MVHWTSSQVKLFSLSLSIHFRHGSLISTHCHLFFSLTFVNAGAISRITYCYNCSRDVSLIYIHERGESSEQENIEAYEPLSDCIVIFHMLINRTPNVFWEPLRKLKTVWLVIWWPDVMDFGRGRWFFRLAFNSRCVSVITTCRSHILRDLLIWEGTL